MGGLSRPGQDGRWSTRAHPYRCAPGVMGSVLSRPGQDGRWSTRAHPYRCVPGCVTCGFPSMAGGPEGVG